MKNTNTFIVVLLTIATSFVSCKKDNNSLKSQLLGKWNVTEIKGADASKKGNADYFTFTSNNDDQVERSLGGQTRVGSYIVIGDVFNMTFSDGNLYCTKVVLSANKLQFESKDDKGDKVSTYTLTR